MTPDAFQGRLLPQEKIVWSGRPRQGLMLTSRDMFLIPFSLLWGGFAIFWEYSVLTITSRTATHAAPPIFMALFGIPFVLIGLFLIFGRFFVDAWARARLEYGLTDRRILIARSGPWATFAVVNLDRLPEASLSEGRNGGGTIRFGPPISMFTRGSLGSSTGMWVAALDPTPQFLAIDNAQRVFDLIQARAQR